MLVLWSKRRGKAEEYKIDGLLQENLVAQLESLEESADDFGPAYACQATNWSPVPMMRLLDFVYALDKERPDHWGELKYSGTIREDVRTYDELNMAEIRAYEGMKESFMRRYY